MLAAATLVLLAVITVGVDAASADPVVRCTVARVPVAGGTLTMAGTLCEPAGATNTVVVLVPGATYDQTYWNFPYDPDTYNFRLALNHAGYSTFTLDRLGTGASSKPLSLSVTSSAQASAIHDVITALRDGAVGPGFAHFVLGAHSLGSVDAVLEASRYHDEDAVLITGLSHRPNYLKLSELVASTYPAALDPVTRAQGYSLTDVGYFTTDPGNRPTLFYGPGFDPEVAAVDEATKSVYSLAEPVDGAPLAVVLPLSDVIDVPVLIVNGAEDPIFCNPTMCASSAALRRSEAADYAAAPCLSAYVLPDSGHDVNLANDAGLYQARVISWLGELPAQRAGSGCPSQ
jgi:pimeloyl-ACP methyl ester carboxylesterase